MTPVKILRPSNSPIRLTKAEYGFDFLIPEHLLDHSWKANYCIVGLLQFNLVLLLSLKDRILICS